MRSRSNSAKFRHSWSAPDMVEEEQHDKDGDKSTTPAKSWSCGDWRSGGFSNLAKVELSDCTDLVEVPGGSDYNIRRLQDDRPEFCWRYPEVGASIQYHYRTLAAAKESQSDSNIAPPGQHSAQLPPFYGVITHCYSPYDFCVQPKFLLEARAKLELSVNETYSSTETPLFKHGELFERVPCAANLTDLMLRTARSASPPPHTARESTSQTRTDRTDSGQEEMNWARGRVVEIKGTSALVRLVDKGRDVLLSTAALRPLYRRHGKLPPLAMKCRAKGVYVNDLEVRHCEEFKRLLAACNFLVRVELANTTEPYHVNLYHPTVENRNLIHQFYRAPVDREHEAAKQRKFVEHLKRMCHEESDFDDEGSDWDDYEDEEEEVVEYVREFDRADRVYRLHQPRLFVGWVENTRVISLHTEQQLVGRRAMEEALNTKFPTLPKLPESWLEAGTACVVKLEAWPRPSRATIEAICEDGDTCKVVLVDYGNIVRVPVDAMRVVPSDAAVKPYVYVIGLYNQHCWLFPHPTETEVLREILQTPGYVEFELEKGKNNPPRGKLTHETLGEVNKLLRIRLASLPITRRFVHPCTDLVVPSPIAPLLAHRVDMDFEHRTAVPSCLLKGTLAMEPLPTA